MKPYLIKKKAGFDILFTGIVTEKIIDSLAKDKLVGSFITLNEASREVGKICNAYKNDDIDLTILLTHIGFESDKKLAAILRPEWGVDMIIGGHSHTVLDQPEKINNILIAQAGVGTDQIGRFDILVDDDTNSIIEWKWQLIPITSDLAKADKKLLEYIDSYKKVVDKKYNSIICRLAKNHTHPNREIETELGNLFSDAFADMAQSDVAFIGSGSIRTKEMGPLVTLQDIRTCFPYDDTYHRFSISGKMLKNIFSHIMRKENRDGEGECYQINEGVEAIYDDKNKKLISLKIRGHHVNNDKYYTFAIAGYHYNSAEKYIGLTHEELNYSKKSKVIMTSMQEAIEEYLRNSNELEKSLQGRLQYI